MKQRFSKATVDLTTYREAYEIGLCRAEASDYAEDFAKGYAEATVAERNHQPAQLHEADQLITQLATVVLNPAIQDHIPPGLKERTQRWLLADHQNIVTERAISDDLLAAYRWFVEALADGRLIWNPTQVNFAPAAMEFVTKLNAANAAIAKVEKRK